MARLVKTGASRLTAEEESRRQVASPVLNQAAGGLRLIQSGVRSPAAWFSQAPGRLPPGFPLLILMISTDSKNRKTLDCSL